MSALAQTLQLYGGWGCTAALAFVCRMLYRDLQAERAARLADEKAHVEELKKNGEAWEAVIDSLRDIQGALERRK